MNNKTYYIIVYGELSVNRKDVTKYNKGDAIWGNEAKLHVVGKYTDLEEANEILRKYECSYTNIGIAGMRVKEYALIVCVENDNSIIFDKANYKLAEEELPSCGGDVHVFEKYILDGELKSREAINVAIRNKTHILEDYFDDWSNWEYFVEYRDGKTIILEEYMLD